MLPDYRTSTAIHEAAHAAISCALGEEFDFIELTGDREGNTMPFHSPCRICGSSVPDGEACSNCLTYYEKHNPQKDARSREINRGYRLEAAVAAAGELAESKFGLATLLASEEELEDDRDRVSSRASLRHLWANGCSNYSGADVDCQTCTASAAELRNAVRQILEEASVWSGITALAGELKVRNRLSGAEARQLLKEHGGTFGSHNIDTVWPPLP
jgi:hypothetical protein